MKRITTLPILLLCILALTTSCKKQYKLKIDESVPKDIAARIKNKTYTEGRNTMIEEKGWKVFVDIKNGKVENIWYQNDGGDLMNTDSIHVMAKEKDPNRGGGNRVADCTAKSDVCQDACPWVVIKRDLITGKILEEGLDPSCLANCDAAYDRCMHGYKGLKNNIGVFQ